MVQFAWTQIFPLSPLPVLQCAKLTTQPARLFLAESILYVQGFTWQPASLQPRPDHRGTLLTWCDCARVCVCRLRVDVHDGAFVLIQHNSSLCGDSGSTSGDLVESWGRSFCCKQPLFIFPDFPLDPTSLAEVGPEIIRPLANLCFKVALV